MRSNDTPTITRFLTEHPLLNRAWYGRVGGVRCRDEDGETPLHVASINNAEELIKLLLAHGSDPTTRDLQDRLPYNLCSTKEARMAYREYREEHPDQWATGSVWTVGTTGRAAPYPSR